MFDIVFLFFLILIVYKFNVIQKKKQEINKILPLLIDTIDSIEEEARVISKKEHRNLTEIEKYNKLLEKTKRLLNILSYVSNSDKLKLLKIISLIYHSKAEFKKQVTLSFYKLLLDNGLEEQKVYNLTYILNRFLNDLFRNPLEAVINLVYRFFVFLKKFHYFK